MISGTKWARGDAQEHIKRKVAPCSETGCWLWSQRVDRYGMASVPIRHRRKSRRGARVQIAAHRLAYEAFAGRIPDGMCVCHRCDVPACCNPDHLLLGTNAENIADKVAKGRQRAPRGEAHGCAKLTKEQVVDIRSRYKAGGVPQRELAAEFGVSQRQISLIVRNERWASV